MKKKQKILIAIGAIVLMLTLKKAQTMLNIKTKKDFIDLVKPYADTIEKKYGIPSLFILAQTSLESGYGKSGLFKKYLNIGGIKARQGDPYVVLKTKEVINGKLVTVERKFAKYANMTDSINAYIRVLNNRYFKKYQGQTDDPVKYAELLQSGKVKYATSLTYVPKIARLVKEIKTILDLN